ncbi:MAG: RNA polymerase sigma factor [Gemmatimonadota bacterium]
MRSIKGAARPTGTFEDLLSVNLDALYRTSLRLCGEPDDAQDLLQDTVLRAFEHRDELRDPEAGRSWLFTILTRTHLNRLRSSHRRRERIESDLEEWEFESALADWSSVKSNINWLDRLAEKEHVHRAVEQLDTPLRMVLLMSDVEDFTQREIAAILDIPEGTVASRLFRARRALREILSREAESNVERNVRRRAK